MKRFKDEFKLKIIDAVCKLTNEQFCSEYCHYYIHRELSNREVENKQTKEK